MVRLFVPLALIATAAVAQAEVPVRLNDLTMIGTHNSYKLAMPPERMAQLRARDAGSADSLDYAHRSLVEQLDAGARQLEIDIWHDPKGGRYADGSTDPAMQRPGFKVQHMAGFDNRSNCLTLVQCLTIIRDWSDAHPGHVPILLMVNAKDEAGAIAGVPYDAAAFHALDAEVRSVLAPDKLIVPDDVRGGYPTLRDAVLANSWPTLEASRGKLMFALDEGPAKVALYRGARASLEGRVFFVNTDENSPAAAYLTLNEPVRDADRIARAVKANFLVRTRADANTREARVNDTGPRDAALKSGAHYISTDYLWPDPRFAGGYRVTMPGGAIALCNLIRRPQGCGGPITEADAR